MSAGTFTIRFYEADSGELHACKQQPESANLTIDGAANLVLSGPATSPFWAKTNRGAKEYGLRPRKLNFRFNPGQEPADYATGQVYGIVIYSKAVYDAAVIGSPATYLGGGGQIVGRSPEDIYPVV